MAYCVDRIGLIVTRLILFLFVLQFIVKVSYSMTDATSVQQIVTGR